MHLSHFWHCICQNCPNIFFYWVDMDHHYPSLPPVTSLLFAALHCICISRKMYLSMLQNAFVSLLTLYLSKLPKYFFLLSWYGPPLSLTPPCHFLTIRCTTLYLYKSQNVFVHVAKCICLTLDIVFVKIAQIYFSLSQHWPPLSLTPPCHLHIITALHCIGQCCKMLFYSCNLYLSKLQSVFVAQIASCICSNVWIYLSVSWYWPPLPPVTS